MEWKALPRHPRHPRRRKAKAKGKRKAMPHSPSTRSKGIQEKGLPWTGLPAQWALSSLAMCEGLYTIGFTTPANSLWSLYPSVAIKEGV